MPILPILASVFLPLVLALPVAPQKVLPSQPFKLALVYHWNSDERDAKHLESSPEALRAYKDGIRYLRKGK